MSVPHHKIEVAIENFQSLEKASFTFETGITLLTGPNNSGKTAVFRALQQFYYNTTSDYIRQGAEHSTIQVTHDSQKGILRRFKNLSKEFGSKAVYRINGEVFTKTGRSAPPELIALTKVEPKESQSADFTTYPNFWMQETSPFLLNLSPAKIYDFLLQDKELLEILSDLKGELKEVSSKAKFLAGRMETEKKEELAVIKKLDSISPFIPVFENLETINLQIKEFETLYNLFELEVRISSEEAHNKEELEKTRLQKSVLSSLPSISIWQNLSKADSVFHNLETQLNKEKLDLEVVKKGLEQLSHLDLQEGLNLVSQLSDTCLEYISLTKDIEDMESQINQVKSTLKTVEEELASFELCPLCGREII